MEGVIIIWVDASKSISQDILEIIRAYVLEVEASQVVKIEA